MSPHPAEHTPSHGVRGLSASVSPNTGEFYVRVIDRIARAVDAQLRDVDCTVTVERNRAVLASASGAQWKLSANRIFLGVPYEPSPAAPARFDDLAAACRRLLRDEYGFWTDRDLARARKRGLSPIVSGRVRKVQRGDSAHATMAYFSDVPFVDDARLDAGGLDDDESFNGNILAYRAGLSLRELAVRAAKAYRASESDLGGGRREVVFPSVAYRRHPYYGKEEVYTAALLPDDAGARRLENLHARVCDSIGIVPRENFFPHMTLVETSSPLPAEAAEALRENVRRELEAGGPFRARLGLRVWGKAVAKGPEGQREAEQVPLFDVNHSGR